MSIICCSTVGFQSLSVVTHAVASRVATLLASPVDGPGSRFRYLPSKQKPPTFQGLSLVFQVGLRNKRHLTMIARIMVDCPPMSAHVRHAASRPAPDLG